MNQKMPLSASFVLSEPRSNYYPPPPPPFPLSSPPPPLRVLLRREEGPPLLLPWKRTISLFTERHLLNRRGKGGRNRLLICPPVLRRERLITQVCASPHLQKDTRSKRVLSPPTPPIPHPRQTQWASVGRGGGEGEYTCCVVWRHGPLLPLPRKKGGGGRCQRVHLLSFPTYVAALLRRRRH